MVDYRVRGIHVVVCETTGLSYQVMTYGVPFPSAMEIEARMRGRGAAVHVIDEEREVCRDKFDSFGGRLPGVSDAPPRHFFSERITADEETVQVIVVKVVSDHTTERAARLVSDRLKLKKGELAIVIKESPHEV